MTAEIFRPLRWGVVVSLLALVSLLVAGCSGSQEEEKSAPHQSRAAS